MTKKKEARPPVSKEAQGQPKKNKKQRKEPSPDTDTLRRVTMEGGANSDIYAYQDGVLEEDPIKTRHFDHTMEYKVGRIATPAEMADGHAAVGIEKGEAVYFVPPTKNTLGVYVGTKSMRSEFFNDSDQTLIIDGAWCKNWSDEIGVIDTVEPFRVEVPPTESRTVTCKEQWNWPMFAADTETGKPASYLMMRYYVHSSDAWSEKYKATSLTSQDGTPVLLEQMKSVTAYRRVDYPEFYTTGGATDDEDPTKLIAYGTFYDFSDIHLINGTKPFPPSPYKKQELVGRIAGTKKKIRFYGHPANGYKERAQPVYQDVVVDLSTTGKLGLGVYPVDYYDEEYGWAGMLVLCTIGKDNIDEDTAPTPWMNTYTDPNMSDNSRIEWELPALGSLTLDENSDDMAVVAGRFKYSDSVGSYVLWDYMRNKPSLIGSGYNSFAGDYKFYGPKCFTGPKTVIKGVIPPAFAEELANPHLRITWGGIFEVVCTVVEILYVATQALGHHFGKQTDSLKFTDPAGYQDQQRMIDEEATSKLKALMEQQEEAYRKLRVGSRD